MPSWQNKKTPANQSSEGKLSGSCQCQLLGKLSVSVVSSQMRWTVTGVFFRFHAYRTIKVYSFTDH